MSKKRKIILIVVVIILILLYFLYKMFYGPIVPLFDKIKIEKISINYLNKKYGNDNFKIKKIYYDYDMETLFDYSNPIGYMVTFKSDKVSDSFLMIDGLISEEYSIDSDYYVQRYYFPNEEGYNIYKKLEYIKPTEKMNSIVFADLQEYFDVYAYDLECEITLDIPDDFGRMPTYAELETNTNLYKLLSFEYDLKYTIGDTDSYESNLKEYVLKKYNVNPTIYIRNNKHVEVSLDNDEDDE